MSLAGFKVHFSPTTEGMALEDFNGQEIWDAAWGEADYDGEQEEDEDEEGAPWGLTDKRIESFPELPEEEELKEKEEVRTPGHRLAATPCDWNTSYRPAATAALQRLLKALLRLPPASCIAQKRCLGSVSCMPGLGRTGPLPAVTVLSEASQGLVSWSAQADAFRVLNTRCPDCAGCGGAKGGGGPARLGTWA